MAPTPPDMTSPAALKSASRKRFVTALCAAGVIAVALGGNLLAAGAEDAAVSDQAAAQQAQSPAEAAALATPPSPTTTTPPATTTTPPPTTTTPPATTTTPPPTTTTPATTPAPAPAPPATSTPTTTPPPPPATHTATAPATGPATAPAPAPATATGPAQGAPADVFEPEPGAATRPVPLGDFAGPAVTPAGARCRAASKSGKAAQPGVTFSSDGSTDVEIAGGCATPHARSQRTISPERLEALMRHGDPPSRVRTTEGVPTAANPTMSLALPGPVPVGVPNFFIDKFRIPPFLLPIYQAAGIQYGVRWQVLAAINEIETDYGRNLNVSSAGALGWMQFMPETWQLYGTDANSDGRRDPFNPVDAIFAAARYLKAAGADQDLRKAIFAYNHADWYVESVLMRARLIGGLPTDLVGSLSGLTQGHFPVFAKARYADDIAERRVAARVAIRKNAAAPAASEPARRGIDIFAHAGAPVIAVQDATITAIGRTKRLGRYVKLRDVYGNTYTYGQLAKIATRVPVPKARIQSRASIAKELALPQRDPKPVRAASAGTQSSAPPAADESLVTDRAAAREIAKERLFAHPGRTNPLANGGAQQILELESSFGDGETLKSYLTGAYGLDKQDVVLKRLAVGRRVIAGTILGRIGKTSTAIAPRLHFEIRPAGRGAPRIDPKPILDGWKLLESTAIYRAQGKNALLGGSSIGQIMLMSKEALAQRVLANPRIEIYSCGRRDIEAGTVDRRVLATLEFLAASGLKPTITSLTCGHGYYTAGGNVSEHSSGNAVDIAKINGIPILGHQGAGSITDIAIRRLLTLQGTMRPHQIISLMTYDGVDNTLALPDHADHIHVGFHPAYEPGTPEAHELEAVLKPTQWVKLIDRLGRIDNPTVDLRPSKYAIRVPVRRASLPHRGE
jgi:Transglycosylase SLT domain/Peptidase family M23